MEKRRIRRATPADAAIIADLGGRAFRATFGHLYPPEDLADFLASAHGHPVWAGLLTDPALAAWLVTNPAGVAIGYVLAGPCKLPVPALETGAGEIRQLYLLAPWQGAGIGTELLGLALGWLEARQRQPVYVGVWSGNAGAQRLYARHGFHKVGEYDFPVGRQRDREFILRRG